MHNSILILGLLSLATVGLALPSPQGAESIDDTPAFPQPGPIARPINLKLTAKWRSGHGQGNIPTDPILSDPNPGIAKHGTPQSLKVLGPIPPIKVWPPRAPSGPMNPPHTIPANPSPGMEAKRSLENAREFKSSKEQHVNFASTPGKTKAKRTFKSILPPPKLKFIPIFSKPKLGDELQPIWDFENAKGHLSSKRTICDDLQAEPALTVDAKNVLEIMRNRKADFFCEMNNRGCDFFEVHKTAGIALCAPNLFKVSCKSIIEAASHIIESCSTTAGFTKGTAELAPGASVQIKRVPVM